MHFGDCVGVEAAGNRTREVTRFNRTPARALAGATREQLPKWRHTNRQFMATRRWGIYDRGLPCPAGPTRNPGNLLRCGGPIRLRKIAKRLHRLRSAIRGKAVRLRQEGLLPPDLPKHFDVNPPKRPRPGPKPRIMAK